MAMQTCYSVGAVIRKADALLDDIDTISFDLFDTLLVRRTHDPDLVKLPVARFIRELAARAGIEMTWQQVHRLRNDLEKALRAKTGETHVDQEAHYPTLMGQVLAEIFGEAADAAVLERVTAYELEMENAMLVPRHEFLAWLDRLRERGKRLLVISDMYLPADHLEVLLEHAGLRQRVDEVFSSADSFRAKASGLAYPMIGERLGLEPGRWLHVGDNPISDGFRATEHGCHALVLRDPGEARRIAITARHYFYSRRRPFWKGRALQQLMAPLEAEVVPRSPRYIEGYNFFGPLIGVFVQTIAERCREKGIRKVFFMSREGWMFKQYWEKAVPRLFPDGDLPEIEYLYVSRIALAGASCAYQGLTRDNAGIVFLPQGNRDFSDVCRVFGFELGPLEPFLARHDLDAESVLSPNHDGFDPEHSRNFENLLRDEDFQQEVRRQTRPGNDALQRYLDDIGFFTVPDVALVDIGWLGTIQRFFHESIAHRDDRPRCHGMLFGATRGIPFKTREDNAIEGIIFERHRFDFAASAILYARDLFEEACRAPHPTLVGYRLDGEGYELQFREMDDEIGRAEREQDAFFADLQQGVLDSAERFGGASALLTDNIVGYRPWINYLLVSKLAFPSRREIRALRYRHHLDDFHGSKKPRPRRRPQLLQNPWEVHGWRLWLSSLFKRRLFRRHLRTMVNQG